jgi:hypothetical protein
MVKMTGYAVNDLVIRQNDACNMYTQKCSMAIADERYSCEQCCALDFNCGMEKCRYIAKEFDPVKKTSEITYCIDAMSEHHSSCLDNCKGADVISPILEAAQ